MSDILLMEAANLFIGEDPEKSKHLKLQSLALPTLEYGTSEHMPGGGPLAVQWTMGQLKPLEPTFKLIGFDEEAYAAAGVGSNVPRLFTARGSIRRKSDGRLFGAVAVIKGTLSKIAPEAFEASKALGHDHAMADVTRYSLEIGGRIWFDVDYFAGKRSQFGVDEWRETRQLLGLPV